MDVRDDRKMDLMLSCDGSNFSKIVSICEISQHKVRQSVCATKIILTISTTSSPLLRFFVTRFLFSRSGFPTLLFLCVVNPYSLFLKRNNVERRANEKDEGIPLAPTLSPRRQE